MQLLICNYLNISALHTYFKLFYRWLFEQPDIVASHITSEAIPEGELSQQPKCPLEMWGSLVNILFSFE